MLFKICTGKPIEKRPFKKDLGVDMRKILERTLKIGVNSRNWIDSSHDRGYLKAFMNAPLKLRISYSKVLVIS